VRITGDPAPAEASNHWQPHASMLRLLVIRLSSVGDIVHALPAVSALGQALPDAQIDWAVERCYSSLLEQNPFVRGIVEVDTLGWSGRLCSAATLEEIVRTTLELRRPAYDVAIDFQGLMKSAVAGWLSGSRERIGLSEYWLKEPLAALWYTERVSARDAAHVIDESMVLAEHVISTRGNSSGSAKRLYEPAGWIFPLPRRAEDDRYVDEQLRAMGVREFIIVNPGGGWMAKRWAPENYAAVVRRLGEDLPHHILLTGSAEEAPMIERIREQAGSKRAVYFPSTLMQLIALARRASLFLGGDTGPMHLAAAIGTPIVAIYGPTNPARNGPFSHEDIALSNLGPINHTRRGANSSYLQGISVEAVMDAIHRRLALRPGQQR
jgi:heptosyltransferase I